MNKLLFDVKKEFIKFAIESPNSQKFEMDFSKLAYAFIQDRAASLLEFMIGFEVVEKAEDDSRAVGLFGFKINDSFYYVPAFFLNSQIKGIDSLFFKEENQFLPLTEAWVKHIVNKQPYVIGNKPTDDSSNSANKLMTTFARPDFNFLSKPPGTAKMAASLQSSRVGSIVADLKSVHNMLINKTVDLMAKDELFKEALAGAIGTIKQENVIYEPSGILIDYLTKKGGVQAVNKLMATIAGSYEFAKAATTFYEIKDLFVDKFDAGLQKQAAKITIISKDTNYAGLCSTEDKRKIVRDSFVIKDSRKDEEKSKSYKINYKEHFSSPDANGKYSVLLSDGQCADAHVSRLSTPSNISKPGTLVLFDGGSILHYFLYRNADVFVRDTVDGDNSKIYSKGKDAKNVEIGKNYALLNEAGFCGGIFKIDKVIMKDKNILELEFINRTRVGSTANINYTIPSPFECECYYGTFIVSNNVGNIKSIRADNKTFVLPSNWKFVEVEESNQNVLKPGSLTTIDLIMDKSAVYNLNVTTRDGFDFLVEFNGFKEASAKGFKGSLIDLVCKYGLDENDAREILKEAASRFKSNRLIKIGQMVGVSMPPPPNMPPMGFDSFTGVPIQNPQEELIQGRTMGGAPQQNPVQPGFNLYEQPMGQDATSLASTAAQSGQKNVFDHATIGGLSKLYDTAAILDSYVPEMYKALDRVGRILFLFYWKNDQFAERYGSDDMQNLEDALRNVFKQFGDLVLKLKEKTIESNSTLT